MTGPLDEAVRVVESGGLVVYPTDTLWGLGASIANEAAVARVFEAKRRPRDQPLSVAVARSSEVSHLAIVTPLARRLFRLLPGSLTILLDRKPTVAALVTGGSAAVGLRVPDHPLALALLTRTGPLTATSANVHGESDPRTLDDARLQLGDRADYYLGSPSPPLGAASTVVDARGSTPRILRLGAVSESRIRQCLLD